MTQFVGHSVSPQELGSYIFNWDFLQVSIWTIGCWIALCRSFKYSAKKKMVHRQDGNDDQWKNEEKNDARARFQFDGWKPLRFARVGGARLHQARALWTMTQKSFADFFPFFWGF